MLENILDFNTVYCDHKSKIIVFPSKIHDRDDTRGKNQLDYKFGFWGTFKISILIFEAKGVSGMIGLILRLIIFTTLFTRYEVFTLQFVPWAYKILGYE